jgi:hypothetical protein
VDVVVGVVVDVVVGVVVGVVLLPYVVICVITVACNPKTNHTQHTVILA